MNAPRFTSLLLSILFSVPLAEAQTSSAPKAGDKAPLVQGSDQSGKAWRLSDDVGKTAVLLYFYPKDDTPGCTREACGFRDRISDLQKDGVKVIGVSFDSGESHQKFIEKYRLNFLLIADVDGKIADAYGVRWPGRPMDRRVSFLIDREGKIVHVTDSPAADTHLTEMKAAAAKLKPEG
jgi:peroxiredoxin Q/BCP